MTTLIADSISVLSGDKVTLSLVSPLAYAIVQSVNDNDDDNDDVTALKSLLKLIPIQQGDVRC